MGASAQLGDTPGFALARSARRRYVRRLVAFLVRSTQLSVLRQIPEGRVFGAPWAALPPSSRTASLDLRAPPCQSAPKTPLEYYQVAQSLPSALEYIECVADDVKTGVHTSFPQSVKLEEGEVVVFSYIVYASREDRDRINDAVMKDPRMEAMMGPDAMPFDGKRMIFGGFKTRVAM